MKRMLSILALLGTFLLLPLVAQAQKYTITINQVEHATITADYYDSLSNSFVKVKSGDQVPRMVSLNIMAKPEAGFMVTHYIINGDERESNGGSIRLTVSENLTISARVAPATLHTVTITQPEHGTLKVTDGGKEVASGEQKYFGTRLSVELTPETGYENEYWIVNGKKTLASTKAEAKNKATLTVRADVTVTAQLKVAGAKTMASVTLVKPEHATVKAYKGKYASSSPELAAGEQVEAGSEILVVVTPEAGYVVDYWLFNGKRVERMSSYRPNQQTFKILEASTIEPVLKVSGYKVTYEQPAEGGTLSVTAGYGSSAKPVPSGSRVKEGESLRIAVTVENGYQFKHFLINGKVKTVSDPKNPYTYEYANSDMTIAAVIEKVKPCIVTITPFEHGTLTVKNSRTSAVINNSEEVPMNTSIVIDAKVDPDYDFKHFLINGVETPHTSYYDALKTYSCRYTVTGPVTIAVVAEKKPTTKVTIDPFEHGELVVKYGMYPNSIEVKSGDAVPQGTTISVDAFFDDGYGLDHFLVNGESKPSDSSEYDYIELTVGNTPLKLSAVAKKTHGLIVMVQPDAAQGTMAGHYTDNGQQKDLQDSTWVALETPVTFVVTPKEGYEMDSWKVNDETKPLESADPNQLTLPVTADFKVEPVLKEAAPTEGKITLVQPKKDDQGKETGTLAASYIDKEYGMTELVKDGDMVDIGTEVTFQVTPAEGYEIDHWMVNDQRKDLEQNDPTIINITVTGNLKVEPIMKAKAAPQPTMYKVTLVSIPASEGNFFAYYGDDEKTIQSEASLPEGTKVSFHVTAADGYELDYWEVNDVKSDDMKNPLVITLSKDVKVRPVMKAKVAPQPTMYKVTLVSIPASEGNFFAYYGEDETTIQREASLPEGTKVSFHVTAADGYELDYWEVNDVKSDDMSNPLVITLSKDVKVRPVMKAKAPVNPTEGTIIVKREGTAGYITGKCKTPDGTTSSIFEDKAKTLPNGTEVTLTASLTAGFEVTYTNNDNPVPAEALSADGKVYTFTVNGDATVVAKIAQKQVTGEFEVKWVAEPEEGGEVSASTAEGPISNGDKIAGGTLITVNATAKENFEVDQWFLNDKELESQKGKESHTFALTENVTIKVTFKSTLPPAEYAVTVEPVLPSAEAGAVKLFYKDGSVVASGTKVVTGSEMYVEVKPADKYELETLQVGETKIPAGDEKLIKQADGGFKYAFTVTEATKIQATFKLINAVEQLTAGQVAVYVANGGTRLEVASAAEGAEVRLYDYTGQLLLTSTEHALDISALPAGSYIVLVGNYTTRIVK